MNEKCNDIASEGHRDRESLESYDDDIHSVQDPSQLDRIQTASRSASVRASGEIKRTVSNVLSRVASRMTTRSLPEPSPPPDGGVQAWAQCILGFFVLLTTWGYSNSFGAFQAYYTDIVPEPASTISWIGSIQIWLSLTFGAFSGRLLDAGYFLPTFIVGITVQVLGIFLMSISTKFWQLFLTQGVLSGIGAGIYFTPAVSLISTYFDKHRALAVGIATTGNSAGGLVYPVIVNQLIPQIGFAWTTRVIGFINLGVLLVALAFMRPRLPPRKSGPLVDFSAFKEPIYLTFVAGAFFVLWSTYFTFYYIASFGTQALHMPYSEASNLVTIINAVGLPNRIIIPMLADRYGQLNVILPVTAIWVVVAFSWLSVESVDGGYAFTVIFGMASASFQCLFPSTIAKITPKLNMVGTRLGMAFAVISLASLSGPPVGGAILAASGGNYRNSEIWSALSVLASLFLFAYVRFLRGGFDPKRNC
ncbi:major facilitator superfamily domain-containing protein [Xylariaceae sp. FL0255]|nr:major facilitator superfamily domain-containing protein [Xylariaceae sp. FL0255]